VLQLRRHALVFNRSLSHLLSVLSESGFTGGFFGERAIRFAVALWVELILVLGFEGLVGSFVDVGDVLDNLPVEVFG
jgi:hypothetical protein